MKKHLFTTLFLAMTVLFVHAQSYQLLSHHCLGDYYVDMTNLTQLPDGHVVANTTLSNTFPNGISPSIHYTFGRCLLKVSYDEARVVDSVIDYDSYIKSQNYLFDHNPNGEDCIFARIKSDIGGDSLCISRYDENFVSVCANVSVPLEEEAGYQTYYCLGNDDFIMSYDVLDLNGTFFSRYGFDGTLKNKVFYHDSVCPIHTYQGGRLKVWNQERTEYLVCGIGQGKFAYILMDSTLNIIDSATIYSNASPHFMDSYDNDIENMDDETYLLATHYRDVIRDGILLAKRSKTTHGNLKRINFPEADNQHQRIIGLGRSGNGDYYLVYKDADLQVLRFDSDLNIIWERTYSLPDGYYYPSCMKALNNGGLAIGGMQTTGTVFMLIVNDDGTTDTPEMEGFVRPFMFYPNPAQDQLHLQYSPDVTPAQIELYDLQGRLVRMQSKSLESVDLQGLTARQYLMKVTMEDGKSYSDKVVKK